VLEHQSGEQEHHGEVHVSGGILKILQIWCPSLDLDMGEPRGTTLALGDCADGLLPPP